MDGRSRWGEGPVVIAPTRGRNTVKGAINGIIGLVVIAPTRGRNMLT